MVALDRGSLKEVVGDGGIVVEERRLKSAITDLADALLKVTDLKMRERLSKQAVKRAKLFSWRKFAENVFSLYKDGFPLSRE